MITMLPVVATMLLGQPANAPATAPLAADALTRVSETRVREAIDTLSAFGTRHTLSETASDTRGIGAARRWLQARLEAVEGATVTMETFTAPRMQRLPEGAELVNVVAVIPGSMPEAADRRYYVVGHYDTINADRMDPLGDAPGANDDASGTAVVLECAAAVAGMNLDATVVFLCTAGEEQGLVGARYHADGARGRGEQIMGVLSNDIVGDPSVPVQALTSSGVAEQSSHATIRLFSEGIPVRPTAEDIARTRRLGAESDSSSRQIARFVAYVARREKTAIQPTLVFRQDRFLRGGDHSAFNEAGFAAVRFSVPAEDYTRQHANVTQKDGKPYGDVPEFVDAAYVANVARLNLATLIYLANAPRPPANVRMITAKLETGTTVRWEKSPEPDTGGYEVVWRMTTSPDWEGAFQVEGGAGTTEWTTPASKDNYFFGVRAYDRDGYRSPVGFAGAAGE